MDALLTTEGQDPGSRVLHPQSGRLGKVAGPVGSEAIAPSDLCGGTQPTALEKGAQV